MSLFKIKTPLSSVGRGLILAGVLTAGAGAVLTLAAASQQTGVLAQKSEQPSEFESSARTARMNLTDEQRTQIRAIERAAIERRKSVEEQLATLEQTAARDSGGETFNEAALRSGLARARAALQFDLDSMPTRTAQEIRRVLTVKQRAVLDAE